MIAEKIAIEFRALGKMVEILNSEFLGNHTELLNETTDLLIFVSESLQSTTVRAILNSIDDFKMKKMFITMKPHSVTDRDDVIYVQLPNTKETLMTNFLDPFVTYSMYINVIVSTYYKKYIRGEK